MPNTGPPIAKMSTNTNFFNIVIFFVYGKYSIAATNESTNHKINAIINAVKQKYKDREIIAFFRPDRVSRLNYFAFDFVSSLKRANEFYVVPFLNNTDE